MRRSPIRTSPTSSPPATRPASATFGFLYAPLLAGGNPGSVLLCLSLGLGLMGLSYGPLGAALGSLFPTAVRYTGASLTFNLAGIVGASLTPYAAKWLADHYGLPAVEGLAIESVIRNKSSKPCADWHAKYHKKPPHTWPYHAPIA